MSEPLRWVLLYRYSKDQRTQLEKSLPSRQYIWHGSAKQRYDSLLLEPTYIQRAIVDPAGTEMGEAVGSMDRTSSTCLYVTIPHGMNIKSRLIIDSRLNNTLGLSLFSAANKPDTLQQIELEGDFSDVFKVFIEPGGQIEALSILNPKVMTQPQSIATRYDIELSSTRLFMTMPFVSSINDTAIRETLQRDVRHTLDIVTDAVNNL